MNERIKKLLELLQMSPADMSVKLNVQRSTFSHLLSGRNKPSFDFISSFLSEFPNVNPDYLILGKLPVLRSDSVNQGSVDRKDNTNLFETILPIADTPPTPSTKDTQSIDSKEVYISNISDRKINESQKLEGNLKRAELNEFEHNNQAAKEEPKLVMVVHHYSNGTFTAYTPK
tara:strand:- start:8969 stop:9487 length:519 start_codon:yes stop_codon:yes gene_type:complete